MKTLVESASHFGIKRTLRLFAEMVGLYVATSLVVLVLVATIAIVTTRIGIF